MTIVNELQRIENNIKASYTALADKGAELPTKQNSDNLASTIANLEVGGGGNDETLKSIIEGTATEIVLPDNVTKIAQYFFYGGGNYPFSDGITSIKANGVTELENYALGFQKIKTFELPNLKIIGNYGLTTGASSNSSYSKTEKIILGKLEKVGNYAFNGLFNYDGSITPEIEMSFNNCEIGNYAFRYYNLPSFDGTGVKSLGDQVFNYVGKNFKKVWFPKTIETITASSMFRFASGGAITLYTDVEDENSVPTGWSSGWCAKNSGGSGTIAIVYGATYEDFLNA